MLFRSVESVVPHLGAERDICPLECALDVQGPGTGTMEAGGQKVSWGARGSSVLVSLLVSQSQTAACSRSGLRDDQRCQHGALVQLDATGAV